MRKPQESASPEQRVKFGMYVARRLKRAKMPEMAENVNKAMVTVKTLARALDDAAEPVQFAIADRDAADDDLDEIAQETRANLAGRSADAVKKEPYIRIFDKGVGHYTAAPLDQEVVRYGELKKRLEEHLPPADAQRKKAIPLIEAGIKDFITATTAVDKARTEEALARTRLDAADEAFEIQLEKTYGEVLARFGKVKAERFFPRRHRGPAGDDGVEAGGTALVPAGTAK